MTTAWLVGHLVDLDDIADETFCCWPPLRTIAYTADSLR